MSYDLVIRNGQLIIPHDTFAADVGINGERIAAIGHGLGGRREISARGLYVIPGAIDAHVHLTDPDHARLYPPNADSFAVGSRAGAFGGVTSLVDFAAPRAGLDLVQILERRREQADGLPSPSRPARACSSTIRGDDYARTPERGRRILVGPPIREAHHQAALWQALADGTLDIVPSDHGPRPRQPGQSGTGVSSIEARLALVHHFGVRTGRLSPNRWVGVCCTNPATIFGLPRKGQLLPGYDADLVLFDPDKTVTFTPQILHSAIDYCSYDGLTVTGYPAVALSRGKVIVEEGRFVWPAGPGPLHRTGSVLRRH